VTGPAALDQLLADAWPADVTVVRDGWRFRWTSGVTRRANSALPVDGGGDVAALVAFAEDFYRSRRASPLFLVSDASAPDGLVELLVAHSYRAEAETLVATASAASVAALAAGDEAWGIEVSPTPSDGWFDAYWSVESGRGGSISDARLTRQVLLAPSTPSAFVAATVHGEMAGVGQVVVAGDWASVQCMATRPEHRRQGAAGAVLGSLAREALQAGATELGLAVMVDNVGARRLYEALGFEESHRYRYFVPG
jgi:N-acetylglutamate synthase